MYSRMACFRSDSVEGAEVQSSPAVSVRQPRHGSRGRVVQCCVVLHACILEERLRKDQHRAAHCQHPTQG